jgi:hypothetical protein
VNHSDTAMSAASAAATVAEDSTLTRRVMGRALGHLRLNAIASVVSPHPTTRGAKP